jgi:hypothetical protein
MKLFIKDRIYIPQLLLPQNNFLDFTIKKGIIEKVMLTEADRTKYSIVEDSEAGKVTWNNKVDFDNPLEVEFSPQELDYLKRSCEALSSSVYPDDLWMTVEKIYNTINV